MYRLILFFKKIVVLLLFILLESIAIIFYANSTSYTRAKLLTVSNAVMSGIDASLMTIGDYFRLKRTNMQLSDEIAQLRNQLSDYEQSIGLSENTVVESSPYTFISAGVIHNSITSKNNFITIDKGLRDGIEPNMALLTIDGSMVGYVLNCSERFSICMSMLNGEFRSGGKIKDKEYFGSIVWDGVDHRYVTLSDVPKYAPIEQGDTILSFTSTRFPPDTFIGVVEDYKLSDNESYYQLKIRVDARLSSLRRVLVVKNADSQEFFNLQNEYVK